MPTLDFSRLHLSLVAHPKTLVPQTLVLFESTLSPIYTYKSPKTILRPTGSSLTVLDAEATAEQPHDETLIGPVQQPQPTSDALDAVSSDASTEPAPVYGPEPQPSTSSTSAESTSMAVTYDNAEYERQCQKYYAELRAYNAQYGQNAQPAFGQNAQYSPNAHYAQYGQNAAYGNAYGQQYQTQIGMPPAEYGRVMEEVSVVLRSEVDLATAS